MMIFSLQKRFLVFLLLPVSLILTAVGFFGWNYARVFLLEQWVETTRLKLQTAAHRISMELDEKLELIRLIAKAQDMPNHAVMQAFLIQQLIEKNGVRLVDIENVAGNAAAAMQNAPENSEGLYTMELCGDYGFCAPAFDPNATDRSLRIIRMMGDSSGDSHKRLVVRVNFDSFLAPIKEMAVWEGSFAYLVTSTGRLLASTDKSSFDRKKLGETGDGLELKVLEDLRHKEFGTVFGPGRPPEKVAGFYKIPLINWYLVLVSQGKIILAPMVTFSQYYALAGILCIIVIVMLIRFSTRSVVNSVSLISSAADKVSNGDYSVKMPETSPGEIGLLNRSFNAMTDGLRRRELVEQTFGRYVDKKVAEELMSRPEALRLGGEKRTVTILMSDLRNFTSMSEKMEPEEVITLLNRYFAAMINVIEQYKGIIVDFYGDSILVFFNGIQADIASRASEAIRCALEMQSELDDFVRETARDDLPVLRMGIGVHTGEVIVGNIGTYSRAKYGIVGSDVNLTDRIQATAGPGKVVISQRTYETVCEKLNVSMEFKACLKGVEDQKVLYEVESIEAHCSIME